MTTRRPAESGGALLGVTCKGPESLPRFPGRFHQSTRSIDLILPIRHHDRHVHICIERDTLRQTQKPTCFEPSWALRDSSALDAAFTVSTSLFQSSTWFRATPSVVSNFHVTCNAPRQISSKNFGPGHDPPLLWSVQR